MVAHNRQNLTQRMVDSLKPPPNEKGEELIMDAQVPGLGIRVRYSGKKTYLIRWGVLGQFKKMTLADAKITTLEDARRLARQKLGEVAGGDDPLAERTAWRNNPSVVELGEEVMQHLETLNRSKSYLADCRHYLDAWIIPAIGDKRVREVEARDVERLVKRLKDKPRTGNKLRAFLSRMFKLARQWTYRLDDPTYGTERFEQLPRERFYTLDELKRVHEVLTALVQQARYEASANATLLLMFTGSRPKELLSSRWEMFDLDTGIWTKPSQHTKSKKLHSAMLVTEALEVLRRMKAKADPTCPYLFPSDSKQGHLLSIKNFWKTVVANAGVSDANLYDLRKTFATMLLTRGVDIKTVMKLTGHTQATTLLRHYTMVMGGAEEKALDGLFADVRPDNAA